MLARWQKDNGQRLTRGLPSRAAAGYAPNHTPERQHMKTIWKFGISPGNPFRVTMPKGARIIHVETQQNRPCFWAEVDTEAEAEERFFETFGTGHQMPTDMGLEREHVGSFLLDGGTLVFHLYERRGA